MLIFPGLKNQSNAKVLAGEEFCTSNFSGELASFVRASLGSLHYNKSCISKSKWGGILNLLAKF